jgi:hypothetical protein
LEEIMKLVIVLFLLTAVLTTTSLGLQPALDLEPRGQDYCSGTIGVSLGLAFASGVALASPPLSAGLLAASAAFALAALTMC